MIGYTVEGARMEFIKVWVYHDWLHYWRGVYEIYKSTEFTMIGYTIEGACMKFIKVLSLPWLVTLLKGHVWNL